MSAKQKTGFTATTTEARLLLEEIASMCEKAYRRGAQQAIALGLTKEDAAWFRTYGSVQRKGYLGFFTAAHAMPEPNQAVSPREYSKRNSRSALDILRLELPRNEAYEQLNRLFNIGDQRTHELQLITFERKHESYCHSWMGGTCDCAIEALSKPSWACPLCGASGVIDPVNSVGVAHARVIEAHRLQSPDCPNAKPEKPK